MKNTTENKLPLPPVSSWMPSANRFIIPRSTDHLPPLLRTPQNPIPKFEDYELELFQKRVLEDKRINVILRTALLKYDFPKELLPEFPEEIENQIKTVLKKYFNVMPTYADISYLAVSGELTPKNYRNTSIHHNQIKLEF